MKTRNITIIGLRRTGNSVALALKESSLELNLIGHDSDSDLIKRAVDSKIVDKGEEDLSRAASAADILVLAMPSVDLEGTLRVIGRDLQEHTVVIDMTTLKVPGIKLAEKYMTKGFYVGARPVFSAATFSGNNVGLGEARADLFANTVFCLMPGANTDPQAVETAVNFGKLLGASPYFIDPLEYDSLAQGVETIPGLTAAAIFAAINRTTGWRDVLRFADLPFAMSTMPLELGADELAYLALNDKLATLRWLDALSSEINDIRRLVQEGNSDILVAFLDEVELNRAKWLQERRENDWLENPEHDIEITSLRQRLFGTLGSRGGDR